MAEDTISKPRAKRIRLLSQVAALICVGAAVAAVVFGVPMLQATEATPIAFTQVEQKAGEIYTGIIERRADQQSGEDNPFPPDIKMIAETLALVSNAPTVQIEETPAQAGTDDTTTTPPPVASAKTRFVGTVGIGDRLMALVTAGGSQRILGEGDEAVLPLADGDSADPPTVSIRSVSRDEVVLVENGAERTIKKAARTGFAVSTSVASVSSPSAGANPEGPRERAAIDANEVKPVNPDDYRRDDGTIDYEALREAARERARQRQDLRRQRREENGDAN